MKQLRSAVWTRRHVVTRAAGLVAAATFGPSGFVGGRSVSAAGRPIPNSSFSRVLVPTSPLIDGVVAVCHRLEPEGWRDLFLTVSHDELDIGAADLAAVLARPLSQIDRTVPGFEDFALEGTRGIAPGVPARSLLFHALASPNVFQDGQGNALSAFPSPAEIEAVENYVYGVEPPSLDDLRARGGENPLAVVVFAVEYRPGRETVHGKHADCCFSRTGHARLGTTEAIYDQRRREFLPYSEDDDFAFPVQPARYAPFLAVQRYADPDSFGPLRPTEDDRSRLFWTPLHKLFSGPECLKGFDLEVTLSTDHINQKLERFHTYMTTLGFSTGWSGPDTEQFPFVIEGEELASFSADPDHGSGWVMPAPHPLVEPAEYQGKPLFFYYSEALASSNYMTSLQMSVAPPIFPLGPGRTQALPDNVPAGDETIPRYFSAIDPDDARSFPQFLNTRHQRTADGAVVNLNDSPDLMDDVTQGGYWARHFVDFGGDGWVAVHCAELDDEVPLRVPAYSTICPPNFYPYTNQRALTEWAENDVPEELRNGIWVIHPRPLSDRRLAPNINLPVGFSIDDQTVTAIVSLPTDPATEQSGAPATPVRRHLQLPDGAAGLFDPGWDVSQDRTADNQFFLASYGLGTPFIEDAKVCATLSTYWPGAAPDTAREFQPVRTVRGAEKAWPTTAPMTDAELGIVEVEGSGFLPWDGVRGPRLTEVDGEEMVDYPDIFHTDYLDTLGQLTSALTRTVAHEEYVDRVLAMAQVYWALGIRYRDFGDKYPHSEALDRFVAAKAEWTVLSFQSVADGAGEDLMKAESELGIELQGGSRYRFHLFRWNRQEKKAEDIRRILVGIAEQALAYTDLEHVFLRRNDVWEHHLPPR